MSAGEKVKNAVLLLTTSQRVTEALEDSSLGAVMFGQWLNERVMLGRENTFLKLCKARKKH